MLTDLFIRRYPDRFWIQHEPPAWVHPLMVQLTHLFREDILGLASNREDFCHRLHDRVSRELGMLGLERGQNWEQVCTKFIGMPYDLWNDAHKDGDFYFKSRLSMLELALRSLDDSITALEVMDKKTGGLLSWIPGSKPSDPTPPLPKRVAFTGVVEELNSRLRQARVPFSYDRGYLQRVDDTLTSEQIETPFWELLSDPSLKNVATDMKEALDRRDSGGRDSALYSMKALESTIKIISDRRKVTRGTERGAADYIDNLVSAANGRFIDVWEADLLKALFSKVRNPHGHGPGTAPMPSLNQSQETWVLEAAMSWVKSLIRRL